VGVSGSDGSRVYEVETGRVTAAKEMEFVTAPVASSPDGRRRAVLQDDGSVRFYEHE